MHTSTPSGIAASTFFRLLVVAPSIVIERDLAAAAALGRHADRQLARQIAAGDRGGIACDFLGRALRHDLPAVQARARAHVDQPVGAAHDGFVVLDHQHRVALLLQPAQGVDQALVVALVQSDRGLVEHVAHADQARSDAGGQSHALQFAAAQRVGRSIEREVLDAHVFQELEPLVDFLPDRLQHGAVGRCPVDRGEPGRAWLTGQRGNFVDGAARESGTPGPRAAAWRRRNPGTRPRPATLPGVCGGPASSSWRIPVRAGSARRRNRLRRRAAAADRADRASPAASPK